MMGKITKLLRNICEAFLKMMRFYIIVSRQSFPWVELRLVSAHIKGRWNWSFSFFFLSSCLGWKAAALLLSHSQIPPIIFSNIICMLWHLEAVKCNCFIYSIKLGNTKEWMIMKYTFSSGWKRSHERPLGL